VVGGQELAEEWANTTRLGAYDPETLRTFKDARQASVYISGSGQLVRGLLADGLLDELHLFVFPIALGAGDRLFADQKTKLHLKDSHVYPNGVVHLCLTPSD
jgi:dihydrofolate reductase